VTPLPQERADLDTAIRDRRPDLVAALLRDRPELALAADGEGRTPLHKAVGQRDAETAGQLLRRGAPVDALAPDGSTALHLAAACGDVGLVTLLLEHGADPRRPASDGRSPRELAADAGHDICARLMDEAAAGPARRGVVLDGEDYWGGRREPDDEPQPPRDGDGTEAVAISLAW
jgi:ankyrin repeat protein